MILVLGASGYTGLAVTRALTSRGLRVRGLIRNSAHEAAVREAGAGEVVLADLRDLPAVHDAARGTDGIFFIGPRFMPEEAAVGKAVIDIAVRTGVRRFVLSGVYHPTIRALDNHQSKRLIEDYLYKTDLEYVVLQPARFMHGLLLSSWKRIKEDGVLVDAFRASAPMAYVDYGDVAEVVALAFAQDHLVRGTFELAATGQHTLHEVAAAVGKALGRPVHAQQVPLADYGPAAALLANPYSGEGFLHLRDYYDEHGFSGGNSLVLTTLLGRPPTTFEDFCRAQP